jgi:transcription-repair coupling factor (superfamily II helicase)
VSDAYVPDMRQRLALYRRVAAARDESEIDRVLDEVRDRYGPVPDAILNLADYGRLRFMADRLGIEAIDRQAGLVVLRFRERPDAQQAFDPGRMIRFLRGRPDVQLVPPATLRLDLRIRPQAGSAPGRPQAAGGGGHAPSAGGARGSLRGGGTRTISTPASWWTARARAGEVTPGFNKETILRPTPEDPRAPGGLFERVGGLLSTMLEQV